MKELGYVFQMIMIFAVIGILSMFGLAVAGIIWLIKILF